MGSARYTLYGGIIALKVLIVAFELRKSVYGPSK